MTEAMSASRNSSFFGGNFLGGLVRQKSSISARRAVRLPRLRVLLRLGIYFPFFNVSFAPIGFVQQGLHPSIRFGSTNLSAKCNSLSQDHSFGGTPECARRAEGRYTVRFTSGKEEPIYFLVAADCSEATLGG